MASPKFWTLAALDPDDPTGFASHEVRLAQNHTESLLKHGLDAKFARLALVPEVLQSPMMVLRGWKRAGFDDALIYVGRPARDFRNAQIETPPPQGMVFLVFVTPNGNISDWRWEKSDVETQTPRKIQNSMRGSLMADQSNELIDFVTRQVPAGGFSPYCYYGTEEDALMFYFRNEADYAKRLNSRVTVYLSLDGNELLGCQIKGVRRVLEDIGNFDVTIEHGKVKLKLVFLAFLGTIDDDSPARELYLQLGKQAAETDVDVELPVFAG